MTTSTPSANAQIRQKAVEIKDNVVDIAGLAKESACETFGDAKDAAAAPYRAGVEKVGGACDGVVGYVKKNPLSTLAACACIGAIAGYLLSRRR